MGKLDGKRIHFVGVGGSSTSGLMTLAAKMGATVSGSDKSDGIILKKLEEMNYYVYSGSRPDIARSADITVYSGAVPRNDPEVSASRHPMERGAFLGYISKYFDKTVAVAGTHGKTTVTAMISHVLQKTGASHTVHIGGQWLDGEIGVRYYGDEIFVTEACEYRNSFLDLEPNIGIILNTEYDHPDFFKNRAEMLSSYARFAKNVKETLILGKNVDIPADCTDAQVNVYVEGKNFGITSQDVQKCAFVLSTNRQNCSFYLPNAPFEYNFTNAALAAATLSLLGVDPSTTAEALVSFESVKRRFEYVGTFGDQQVYTDYAHHPTQIKALLTSCKQKYDSVTVIFQPHTYSRTHALIDDFVSALQLADNVVIKDSYAAREKYDPEGSARKIYGRLLDKPKIYANSVIDVCEFILKNKSENGIILFVGAGDINVMALELCNIGR